jgi:hypothetical protein
VKREIESYLAEHGDRYTAEALRQQLIEAHYDPVEVDEALREWSASRAHPEGASEKARFARYNWLIHGAALVIVVTWLALVGGVGTAAIGGFILAMALLIGAAVAWVIGGSLLKRTGLGVSLAVSVASALLIGGACFGLMGGLS